MTKIFDGGNYEKVPKSVTLCGSCVLPNLCSISTAIRLHQKLVNRIGCLRGH